MSLPSHDKSRKAFPIWTYMIEYFPDSYLAEVQVAVNGNNQHNPGEPLHWAREKSTDQMNTAARHMFDHSRGVIKDVDNCYHLAKAIWRLKAELQLTIEREQNDARKQSEAADQAAAEETRGVQAHARAKRDGRTRSRLPRVQSRTVRSSRSKGGRR